MKHLKYKFETPETLETQRHRRPQPTWQRTLVTSKLGLGGRREKHSSAHPRRSAHASSYYRRTLWMGAQTQAFPASPFATSEVDGDTVWGAE
jgi:hypothetical protein